jgi:hypothetical protein
MIVTFLPQNMSFHLHPKIFRGKAGATKNIRTVPNALIKLRSPFTRTSFNVTSVHTTDTMIYNQRAV